MWRQRTMELIGLVMIGDGALSAISPRQHTLMWYRGPGFWQRMMEPFLRRPGLTRALGLAGVAAGFWLARRQWRSLPSTQYLRATSLRLREVLAP